MRQKYYSKKSRPYRLGFKFLPSEEARMLNAMEDAIRFMKNYGKGREPYMVDVSHYANHKQQKI